MAWRVLEMRAVIPGVTRLTSTKCAAVSIISRLSAYLVVVMACRELYREVLAGEEVVCCERIVGVRCRRPAGREAAYKGWPRRVVYGSGAIEARP